MIVRKRQWVFVCLCCVLRVVGTTFVILLCQVQVWMPLPETLFESCVCECVFVCV